MSQPTVKEVLLNPIFNNNPIGLQILGICSALAFTSNLNTALVMSVALTLVTAFSNLFISMIGSQRSEGHTSELQSLMRTSYAVFCLTQKQRASTIISLKYNYRSETHTQHT